jgi:YHS domain-containing protein
VEEFRPQTPVPWDSAGSSLPLWGREPCHETRRHSMKVKDPVCGMLIEDSEAKARSTYQGKSYYFCTEECRKLFDQDPARYAEQAGAGVR